MARKILVIDDSELSLNITAQNLEQAGFSVFKVKNANIGLQKLREERIDMIVLDLILPGLDGFSFLSICKQESALKDIPVVVLTGRDSTEEIEEAKKRGAMECFIKYKISPLQLKDYIKSYFEKGLP
ncbi:MAG: response regulator [Candidatus Omnitrophica bacterium]|nr:response regulator [Candidatus Omnitrophota bacterium]MBU1871527.1 response regulator [Candidatus Omnitrophota bacterium]